MANVAQSRRGRGRTKSKDYLKTTKHTRNRTKKRKKIYVMVGFRRSKKSKSGKSAGGAPAATATNDTSTKNSNNQNPCRKEHVPVLVGNRAFSTKRNKANQRQTLPNQWQSPRRNPTPTSLPPPNQWPLYLPKPHVYTKFLGSELVPSRNYKQTNQGVNRLMHLFFPVSFMIEIHNHPYKYLTRLLRLLVVLPWDRKIRQEFPPHHPTSRQPKNCHALPWNDNNCDDEK